MTPEGKVKDKVKKILRKYDVWYFMYVPYGRGQSGIPDYICCVQGRFVAVECKGMDEKAPTTLQQMQLDAISKHGGFAFVVTPSNLTAFEISIQQLARLK